ncbi:MAG: ATP-binding protein [Pyrinomonadaceae bacterium MAG19_C2-C3]|nr:ATP-binding protein [Pyrinomonadaceae bacterium MAG19_C2-C3]
MNKQRFTKPSVFFICLCGISVCAYAIYTASLSQFDFRFVFLALVTLLLASRITVSIPFAKGQVTASETFIFLTMLLCGGEAAILLAAAEGAVSSLPYAKKRLTVVFNGSVLAISTFLSVWTLRMLFGSPEGLVQSSSSYYFIAGIYVIAFVQFAANSGIIATIIAIRIEEQVWKTWSQHFLWTAFAYFASASAAAITAKLAVTFGFHITILTLPIVAVVYFSYQIYRKHVESSAASTEKDKRHIAELSEHILEQERLREQLVQAEKLSALGELASGVAHNFNNTLAGILGRAQLSSRDESLSDEMRRSLEIIIQTATDGANTVRRIQNLARKGGDHNFQLVAVDQILMDVGEVTRPRWKDRAEASNIHINLTLEIDSKALVMGDAGELREVLVNMIFNAVDAMPDGGRLTLATREFDGKVEISISDTGTGMSDEVRSRVFDPFYTTKGTAGMGLGLAVSYGIINRHGGTIIVASEPGHGTTFRITLPRYVPNSAAHASESLNKKPARPRPAAFPIAEPTAKPRILVVEDEAHIVDILREVLEGEGCEVVTCANGTEATGIFDAGNFDAVFTDVGLPGLNGWEVARHIRTHDEHVMLAVITGWGDAVSIGQQRTAKVNHIIAKPFEITAIVELAREIFQHRTVPDITPGTLLDTNTQHSNLIN